MARQKLTHSLNVRFPEIVYNALVKRANTKRKDFPRYNEADEVRSAVVEHLKKKGVLDKDKDHL